MHGPAVEIAAGPDGIAGEPFRKLIRLGEFVGKLAQAISGTGSSSRRHATVAAILFDKPEKGETGSKSRRQTALFGVSSKIFEVVAFNGILCTPEQN